MSWVRRGKARLSGMSWIDSAASRRNRGGMASPMVTRVVAFLVAGVLIGSLVFAVTAWQPIRSYLGPVGITRMIDGVGFDPWTGMGHGRIYEMGGNPGTNPTRPVPVIREPIRTWLGTRHAVPIPIGTALAWIALALAVGALRVRTRLRRSA